MYRNSKKKPGKIEKSGSARAFICRRANLIHATKAYRMICDGRRGLRSGGSFRNIFMTGRRSVILVIVLSYVQFWNVPMRVDFAKKRLFANEIYDFRSETSIGVLVRNNCIKILVILWWLGWSMSIQNNMLVFTVNLNMGSQLLRSFKDSKSFYF